MDLIARDRIEEAAEAQRQAAEIEVRAGVFASLADSVVPPTGEWLSKTDHEPFLPRLPNGTTRTVSTFRRLSVPHASRLHRRGVIDRTGLRACEWYRELHEMTGLAGNIIAVDLGREVFAPLQSRAMFADWQVERQDEFRHVRQGIRSRHLRLLDQVVLHDVALHRAARAARAFHRNPEGGFAEAVEQLVEARKKVERRP